MSDWFNLFVMLHVLCVVGGFGALAYNALYANLASRRTGGGATAVLEVDALVSGLAEILIYAALLFGIAAVAASHSTIKFSDAWISAAFAIYLVDIGILHGWIRVRHRRYVEVVGRLEKGASNPAEADVTLMKRLEKQVGLGWGMFNILVVGVIYLMVFQPAR